MYTYMHAYKYTRIHLYMYTCIHVYMYTCIHVCMYIYIHIHMAGNKRCRIAKCESLCGNCELLCHSD